MMRPACLMQTARSGHNLSASYEGLHRSVRTLGYSAVGGERIPRRA